MIKKIKENFRSKLNKGIKLEIMLPTVLLIIICIFSSLDAITTHMVLKAGGIELNPLMNGLYYEKILFFFYYKVIIYPIFFMLINTVIKEIVVKTYKDNIKGETYMIISTGIICIIFLIASMINLANYFKLIY